jgi:hypothetical protein
MYYDIAKRINLAIVTEDEHYFQNGLHTIRNQEVEQLRNLKLKLLRREVQSLKEIIELQKNVNSFLRKEN